MCAYLNASIPRTKLIYYYVLIYPVMLPVVMVIGLVIDTVQNKMYFADATNKTIQVVSTDGTERKILISDITGLKGLTINWITR